MAIAHSMPRRVAVLTESTFAAGSYDYSADGTAIWVIDPDTSGVAQGKIQNENIRPRPAAYHKSVLGLKSGSTLSFGQYLTASGTHAAEEASAETTELAENIRCWLGGRRLGYCCGVASSSTNTLTVDTGQGSNWGQGDWLFLKPTSSADGQFYRVASVATDTLTLDRNVHASADGTGTAHAVIDCYWDQDALTNHADANHITRAFLVEGQDAEDNWSVYGVKLQGELTGFGSGESPRINFTGLITDFAHEDLTAESIGDTPEGEPPLVVGRGDDTLVWLADYGSALASVTCHSFEPVAGITHEPVTGPNGQEGIHGYMGAGFDDCALSMSVLFDDQYATDFRADTVKHAMIQVGTTTAAIGVYFPRLEYSAEPSRGDGPASVITSNLQFRGLENTADPNALTGDDLESWRSPIHILIVA